MGGALGFESSKMHVPGISQKNYMTYDYKLALGLKIAIFGSFVPDLCSLHQQSSSAVRYQKKQCISTSIASLAACTAVPLYSFITCCFLLGCFHVTMALVD